MQQGQALSIKSLLCYPSTHRHLKTWPSRRTDATETARRLLRTIEKRLQKERGIKWYSRAMMWTQIADLQKDSIEDLTAEEFLDCLYSVDVYFRKNPAVREKMSLAPFKGPQHVEDRDVEQRVNYLGDAAVYKYYDKGLFLCELRALDSQLIPEKATERQYEEALRNTSRTIFSSWAKRSIVDEYRGPQSFVHKGTPERTRQPTPGSR